MGDRIASRLTVSLNPGHRIRCTGARPEQPMATGMAAEQDLMFFGIGLSPIRTKACLVGTAGRGRYAKMAFFPAGGGMQPD